MNFQSWGLLNGFVKAKLANSKNPACGNEDVLAKPPWFNDLADLFECKFKEMDLKVNSSIGLLAADLADFKGNVACELQTMKMKEPSVSRPFNHVVSGPSGTPPRKRKNAHPASTLPPESLPVPALPIAADSYKAVLKLDSADSISNATVLKEMCIMKAKSGTNVPDFQSKASKNGCIEVLFKSFQDALDTKSIFEEKLKKLEVKNPVRKNVKRIDLVGLPYAVSKEEALQALVKDNPQLGLSVCSDDPCSAVMSTNSDMFVSVFQVKKCRDSPNYCVLLHATDCFVNFIENVRIKLMSSVLHKYIQPNSVQCFSCHRFNHYADQCKFSPVCGKCASTAHKTSECTSDTYKCINCVRNNHHDNAHPAYFQKCPFYI